MIRVHLNLLIGISLLIQYPIFSQSRAALSSEHNFSKEQIQEILNQCKTEAEQVEFLVDNFYKIYSNDFQTAIDFTSYTISLAQKNKLKDQEGYCWKNYGVAQYLKGDYQKALISLLKSSTIFDSLNNKKGIASVNNELAIFYNKQNEIEKAYQALDKSEKAALAAQDTGALDINYHHRGTFLSRNGKYEEAKPYFDKVLATRIQTKDSIGIGYILLDLAEYELHQGNLAHAIELIDQSTKIRIRLNDRQGVAINKVAIGEAYFNMGHYSEAIPYFESGIHLATAIGFTDLIRFSHDLLQQCFVNQGDYKQAYENLSKSKFLEDSLFTIEKTKFISELQTKYETEKKEQQILLQETQLKEQLVQNKLHLIFIFGLTFISVLLIIILLLVRSQSRKKQDLLRNEAKVQLQEALLNSAISSQEIERKRFAQDLHDGFGQLISVLNINLKSLEKGTADRAAVFENSALVLDEMYKELKSICFNLMPETLIKSGVIAALKEFAGRINHSGKVNLEIYSHGIESRLEDLQEISLYRISQEWINNILKYSDADRITLQLTKDSAEITLMIEDNGSGFDKDMLLNGKGNGWKNIQSRANLNKGEVELDTHPGAIGTTLILNIPVEISRYQPDSVEI